MADFEYKKAKTHKGRKYLENLKAKIFEKEKKTVFMKGTQNLRSCQQGFARSVCIEKRLQCEFIGSMGCASI